MFVDRADGNESHRISMLTGDPTSPVLKFFASPFKTVVGMAELSGRQRFPQRVVFLIRCCQHDGPWTSELKQHSFEGRAPRRIKMFDDFHHRCGIETLKTPIPVGQ